MLSLSQVMGMTLLRFAVLVSLVALLIRLWRGLLVGPLLLLAMVMRLAANSLQLL